MKHLNRLAALIGSNFIWSFENMYPLICSSKIDWNQVRQTASKYENSTTGGKEEENEKNEGKGKKR